MTHYYCYLFEAKSIQPYLLATNRLKEIVGGSELIESLTGEDGLFDAALQAAGGEFECSRKGGGAAFAFTTDKDARDRLAALWPLLVAQQAPGLEFVQARGEGPSEYGAFEDAAPKLRAERNRLAARLPQPGPFATRNRRSGEVAVALSDSKKNERAEPVDAATHRKLMRTFWRGPKLVKRFASSSEPDDWPVNLNPRDAESDDGRVFPFIGEDRIIALVHCDGNALGQLLIDLGAVVKADRGRFMDVFAGFSMAVTAATQAAAQSATRAVLEPWINRDNRVYPARPIVLGGDDLTLLVRADLALPFTQHFLHAFSQETGKAFQRLRDQDGLPLPKRLSACAGIAYARATQPFYLLHELAEQLCKHAKRRAKRTLPSTDELAKLQPNQRPVVPSALSFHRVTAAFVDDYDDILTQQLTARGLRQTLECYAVEPCEHLPPLQALIALQALLEQPAMARGPTRELLGLIGNDPQQAKDQYKRWRQLMREGRVRKEHPALLEQFDGLLGKLSVPDAAADLPYGAPISGSEDSNENGLRSSPLGDVEVLRSVYNRFESAPAANDQEQLPEGKA